jgi:hypothetical protein
VTLACWKGELLVTIRYARTRGCASAYPVLISALAGDFGVVAEWLKAPVC